MGHTVLQLIDRQHVARTHLFHNAAYHLQYIFIDCQPIATEGGRYVQESHSIQFCDRNEKTQNNRDFTFGQRIRCPDAQSKRHIYPQYCAS